MRTANVSRRNATVAHAIWAAGLSSFLLSGCVTEPETGRHQLILISDAQANQMGVQAFQEVLSQAKVSTDPQYNALVERVGRRIARVTDAHMAEQGRELFQWEFKVIDDPKTANAFALPGGKVCVYTGILPITEDETGLAVVLGHEIGHAYARHGAKRVSEGIVAQFGLGAVDSFLGGDKASDSSKLIMAALGVGYQVGVQLRFSRGDESAADDIGLMLMAEAGYDPRAAVPFWERMQAAGGKAPPEWLSSHPAEATRIQEIKDLLPKAMQRYQRSGVTPAK